MIFVNRAERKRTEKEALKQNKTVVMTKRELDKYKDAIHEASEKAFTEQLEVIKNEWCKTAIDVIMNCMLMALHDEYGFGRKRLQRLQSKAENHMECMNQGYVTLEELRDINNVICEKAKYVGTRSGEK